jgi:phosphatidylglycerophosphate synthase
MTTFTSSTSRAPLGDRARFVLLRRRALLAASLGGLTVASTSLALHAWLETTRQQSVAAVAVFVVMSGLMLVAMRGHHPFPRFGAANQVTMARAVLVAVTAGFLVEPASAAVAWLVVGVTAAVAVLDGVDGWFARRTGMASVFGARFDMETDAFFMLVLSALVWRHHKAGAWVLGIGLMRYAFVAARLVLPWMARPLTPTRRGKTVAITQLVALACALVPQVPVSVSASVCAIALAMLTWSFAVDVRRLALQ